MEGDGIDTPAGKGIAQREPLASGQAINLGLHEPLDGLVGGRRRLMDADKSPSGLSDSGSLGRRN